MKKTILSMTCALFGLSACSSGGGSTGGGSIGGGNGGGGTVPGLPTMNNPAVQDLVAFAASEGSRSTNRSGHDVRTASYMDGGVEKTARLVGSRTAGLLEVSTGDKVRSSFDLVGSDSSRNVNHQANYHGDAAGVVRISSNHAVEPVHGTASIGISTTSGEWLMGADLWMEDGENGLYVGADGGVVDGNKLTFNDKSQTAIVNIHPLNSDNRGATNLDEMARTDIVFSDDGKDLFGTITGSNKDSGFLVDAGFAATGYPDE